MRFINKKVIIGILMLIEVTSLFLCYKSFLNKPTKIDSVNKINRKTFSMYVENGNSTYDLYDNNGFPKAYLLNMDKSVCTDINGNKINNVISYNDNKITLTSNKTVSCDLYFDRDSSVHYKLVYDYLDNKGVELLSETSSDTYPVYYYTGDITNNNLIYAGFCWKMVRTTDTGGVKLIYNGEPFYIYTKYNIIEETEYNVSTNTPTDTPFTFDSSTKKWTSGIAGVDSTTNTIEFTITTAGNYVLEYNVSSESYDRASFYKNGTALKSGVGGTASGTIDLDGLTTSDVIKVAYTKDRSVAKGSDTVSFSIKKAVGEKNIKSCNNSGTATHIETSGTKFNGSYSSPAYVGYMYNKVYTASYNYSMSSDTTSYVYGNSVSWDGTQYTLVNTTSGTWSNLYNGGLNNYRYTCWSTSTTCTSVYYMYFGSSINAYYLTLTGGVNISEALNEMLYADDVNTTNSTIKTKIDSWYESNIKEKTDSNNKLYSNYLENTIYCYNRATTSLGTFNPDGGGVSSDYVMYFNYYSLTCENKTDQFTLKESAGGTAGYGNNTLDYPIGLLTYKEASLARNGSSTNYLNNNSYYWLGSPFSFGSGFGWYVYKGDLDKQVVEPAPGVRPVVSLSSMVKIKDGTGDGSVTSPYEVVLP